MSMIPLYNCYWCRCAYCYNRHKEECFERCRLCMARDKFKMPRYCGKFIEDTSALRLKLKSKVKCQECIYQKILISLKEQIEKIDG